jgi:protein-disulfide isomerase
VGDAPTKGAKQPKVTIIEFSDFQCPFCSRVNGTLDRS